MFLDDELLEMCEQFDGTTYESIQQLNVDVCRKCESYYKSKMSPLMTSKEIKTILDRTFLLFDSFVARALQSKKHEINLFGMMFKEFTYKQQFLNNEELKKIYYKL